MPEHAVDRRLFEQIGGVFDDAADVPVLRFPQRQGEIELGTARRELRGVHAELREDRRRSRRLHHEHDLEQGRTIFLTPYTELGDDALERHVLVVEDLHRFGADAAEKLCEWGIAREIEAKCNGVHERPQ